MVYFYLVVILTPQTKLVPVFDAVKRNFWPSDVWRQLYLQLHERKLRVNSFYYGSVYTVCFSTEDCCKNHL